MRKVARDRQPHSEQHDAGDARPLRSWSDVPQTLQITILVFLLLALVAYLAWPAQFSGSKYLSVLSAVLLTALSCFAAAGVLGLLFGIPRSPSTKSDDIQQDRDYMHYGIGRRPMFVPNTNLEQMSDWLTKILIGAGLVQLRSLVGAISHLATYLAPALGGTNEAHSFAAVLIIFNLSGGFTVGYIGTRTILSDEFEKSASRWQIRDANEQRLARPDARDKVDIEIGLDSQQHDT